MQQIITVEYGKYYAKTMTQNTPGKQKRSLNPSLRKSSKKWLCLNRVLMNELN